MISVDRVGNLDNLRYGVDARVINAGTAASNQTVVEYKLEESPVISPSSPTIASDPVEVLQTGEAADLATEVTLPQEGIFWLGICVDPVVDEIQVGDNCSGTVRVDTDEVFVDDFE